MQSEQIVTEIVVTTDRATPGMAVYEGGLRSAGQTTETFSRTTAGATQRVEQIGRGFSYSERQVAVYLGQLSPTIAAQNRLTSETRQAEGAARSLDRQLMQGSITLADHAQKMALVTGRVGEIRLASQQLASGIVSAEQATGRATTSAGQMRASLFSLGQQVQDVGVQLASGAGAARTFAQQGPQIFTAWQQGGGFKGIGAEIAGMVTRTTLLVGGLAAVAGGFAILLARAQSNAEQLRQFDNILKGFGTSSLATAGDLQQVVRQLRDMGVAAADADAAVKAIIRNPRLNPAAATQISTVGLDVGTRLGLQNPSEGIGRFGQAIASGNVEEVLKLGFALNAVNASEATSIRLMDQHGQRARALGEAIALVSKNVSGEYKNSLTDGRNAIDSISAAWQRMLDALSELDAVQNARTAIINLLKDIADAAAGKPLTPEAIERGWNPAWGPRRTEDRAFPNGLLDLSAALKWFTAGNSGARVSVAGPPGDYGVYTQPGTAGFNRLISSMIKSESNWNPNAVSSAGAQGLMQIMPGTARGLGLSNPFDPVANVDAGSRYIAQLIQQFGTLDAALAAYDWGPGNMQKVQAGQKFVPSGVEGYVSGVVSRAGLTGKETAADLGLSGGRGDLQLYRPDADKISQTQVARQLLIETTRKDIEVEKQWGVQQQASQAYWQKYREIVAQTGDAIEADTQARVKMAEAVAKANIEIGKATTLQGMQTEGERAVTEALKISEAQALKVAAASQARIEVHQRGGDAAQREKDLLDATAARREQDLQRSINEGGRRVETLQLETSLQGQSSDAMAVQLSHQQAIHELQRKGEPLTSQIAQNYLKTADNVAAATVQLQAAQRETQRWDDLVRGVIGTIESSLTSSIEAAFSGQAVDSWGKRVKSMMASIGAQAIDALFLKPALGTLASIAGFGNVASQLGTFGGGPSGQQVSVRSDGVLTIGNAASVASLGKSFGLFDDLGLGSTFSGIKDFFSGGLGGTFAWTPNAAQVAAGVGEAGISIPGSIFGSTTAGSFLGAAGTGLTAGMFLGNVLGADPLMSGIGSGVGSLAGAALGTLVGMPWLGALIGGAAGGGLSSPLGRRKPIRRSAGATIAI